MAAPKKGQEKLRPRDPVAREIARERIRAMYEDERRTSVEIAAAFDVNHKSVLDAMKAYGIARRKVGHSRARICCEADCSLPVYRIHHRTNGSWYGRRCRLHWIVYRMKVNQDYNDKHLGKDDEAWLRRLRQLLARVQRVNREVSRSLKPASAPATTSPAACRR